MKKHLLFALLFSCIGIITQAQSLVQLDPKFKTIDFIPFQSPANSGFYGKTWSSTWFNFIDAADAKQGGAINFQVNDKNTLFPDSLVLQMYGDSVNGYELAYMHLHHIGQVFDPTSFYYPELLTRHNSYEIDSISFAYRYAHFVPGSVDTLEFQVYHDTAVKSGNLYGPDTFYSTAWVNYDTSSRKGLGSSQEWRVLLDADDSSQAEFKVVKLALPQKVHVSAGGLFAITCRYIPGYEYATGDTLGQFGNETLPVKKLNNFQPLIGYDTAKTKEESYNHSLSKRSRYKFGNEWHPWPDKLIPGDAWSNFNEYLYVGFHVNALTGRKPVEENSLIVYPNPCKVGGQFTISFNVSAHTDLQLELYDLLGNKVQTLMDGHAEAGEQLAMVNTVSLASGMYVYRIKAGEQSLSGKLIIIK